MELWLYHALLHGEALKFISLFTLSHGGNQKQQGGVPFMWPAAYVVVWQYFHVAGWNFEEIVHTACIYAIFKQKPYNFTTNVLKA